MSATPPNPESENPSAVSGGATASKNDDPFGLVNAPLSPPAPTAASKPAPESDPFGLVNTPLAPAEPASVEPSAASSATKESASGSPAAEGVAVSASGRKSIRLPWRGRRPTWAVPHHKMARRWIAGVAVLALFSAVGWGVWAFRGDRAVAAPDDAAIHDRLAGLIEQPGWRLTSLKTEVEAQEPGHRTLVFVASVECTEPLFLPVDPSDFLRDTVDANPALLRRIEQALTSPPPEAGERAAPLISFGSALLALRPIREIAPPGTAIGYHGVIDADRVGDRWRLNILSAEPDGPVPAGLVRRDYAGRTCDVGQADEVGAAVQLVKSAEDALARFEAAAEEIADGSVSETGDVAEDSPDEHRAEDREGTRAHVAAAFPTADPLAPFHYDPDGHSEGSAEAGSVAGDGANDLLAALVVYESGELEQPPVPVQNPPAPYPSILSDASVRGRVSVVFFVDEKGCVRVPKVASASRPEFEQTAIDTIRRWRFEPGLKNGRAVMTRLTHVFEFFGQRR